MVRLVAALALCSVAFGQKKPVTMEVAAQPPVQRDAVGTPVWAPDGKSFAWTSGHGVQIYDVASKSRKQAIAIETLEKAAVKKTVAEPFAWENRRVSEQRLQWTPDGKGVLLSVGGDLFLCDLVSGKHDQLTATADAERDPKLSPDGKRVSFQRANELWVLDLTTKNVRRLTHDSTATLWNGRVDWVYPEELDLGTAHWWSPDGKAISFLQFDVSRQWVQPHGAMLDVKAVYEPQRYPKAGTPNADVRLGVIEVDSGRLKWMDTGDPRDVLLARIDWTPDSRRIAVQRMNRVQNALTLLFVEAATGTSRAVITEIDPHWVNVASDLRFLPKRRQFLWSSEMSGFRHLYLYSMEGKREKQLTSGEWEVKNVVAVDEARETVYFHSRERSPLNVDLARVTFGGKRTRVTQEAGTHSVAVSPAFDVFVDTYHSAANPSRKTLRRITGEEVDTIQPASASTSEYEYIQPEVVTVKTKDGAVLYGRLFKPANFDASKKYPAIVSVYGGPHAQNVCDCYAGMGMDQAFAQRGYVVWQLDNRGTAGRGKAFETKLYRRFGKQELADQTEGIQHLIGLGFVDPKRIGMHGWSYGGFMTLYTMTNAPDLIRAGIAGAAVVDWRLYDTIYTERYLGTPQENEEGYRLSSPLTNAKNVKAPLLMLHNIGDDNVLFQGFLQFTVALQNAGIPYESLVYPQKSHGVSGPARKHMLNAMAAFFDRHLKN